jgi:hypothetical protein
MKTNLRSLFFLATCVLAPTTGSAATLYVWQDSLSPSPPYYTWLNAVRNIQEAVDAADPGDTVLVSGGIYDTGGRAVYGTMTNRVVIDKPITVESLMGPEVTVIQGHQVPGTTNGDGAVRCVYLSHGAVLSGFTLTSGATHDSGDYLLEQSGGGAWCESTGALVTNCVLTRNSAYWGGGGDSCRLNNCTVVDNLAWDSGGGMAFSSLKNSVVAYNAAWTDPNLSGSTADYCCTTPLPTEGRGNMTDPPRFVDLAGGNVRLVCYSPCVNAGHNAFVYGATDIDGNPRITLDTVDIGAYELPRAGLTDFISWLGQYALPTDGSADVADSDGDLLNNWEEWTAGTDPTDPNSCLRAIVTRTPFGMAVSVHICGGRRYTLQRCTDMTDPVWTPVPGRIDIFGTDRPLIFTDPDPPSPAFYRVSVRFP